MMQHFYDISNRVISEVPIIRTTTHSLSDDIGLVPQHRMLNGECSRFLFSWVNIIKRFVPCYTKDKHFKNCQTTLLISKQIISKFVHLLISNA